MKSTGWNLLRPPRVGWIAILMASVIAGEVRTQANDTTATNNTTQAVTVQGVRSFLDEFCISCHATGHAEAGVDLSGSVHQLQLLSERETWLSVLDQLRSREMPPEDDKPSDALYESVSSWLDEEINHVDWHRLSRPGRVALARKTTVEYRNAIRDVFGTDLQAGTFLARDPEGNTGFTNDRETLTFPLFAFDDFLREAERAVDAYLGYENARYAHTYEFEDAWAATADKSTSLNTSETGIIAKDSKAPFHLPIVAPSAGIYSVRIRAAVDGGEPLAGLEVLLDGSSVERFVIAGKSHRDYETIVNLNEGPHTLTLAYDPERAPIIQPKFEPQVVPDRLSKQVDRASIPQLAIPHRLRSNKQAVRAYDNLNAVIAGMTLTMRLASFLLDSGETDYERTNIKPADGTRIQTKGISEFRPSKVPFNLTAGKIAIFLEIPQAKFEKQMKDEIGFSFDDYKKVVTAYNRAFAKKHPERIRKKPGFVDLDRISVTSHAAIPSDFDEMRQLRDVERINLLATRAYGRTPLDHESAALDRIYSKTLAETGRRTDAFRDALVGLLVSPPFLLRYTTPTANGDLGNDDIGLRLSHFLWLSVPDRELRAAASNDTLQTAEQLGAMADRMINDSRFHGAMRLFVEQWLDLSTLRTASGLNVNLRRAMLEEPAMLFTDVIRNDRSLLELIDSRRTYVDDMLADHYGIAASERGVTGLRPIALDTDQRGGLLAMGGILVSTSTPNRTSPVTRGAWIVELLLGDRLPNAPPSVPELQPSKSARTVRQQLEQHRSASECSRCHERIDPYGFLLENYDHLGRYRSRENGRPVDSATVLQDGTQLKGITDLRNYIKHKRRDDFIRNLATRMLEFALGRDVRYYDEATVQQITSTLAADGYRGRTLIREIVCSEPFRRQDDPVDPQSTLELKRETER